MARAAQRAARLGVWQPDGRLPPRIAGYPRARPQFRTLGGRHRQRQRDDVLGIDGRFPSELERARALTEAEAPRLIAFLRAHLAGFANARIDRYADAVYVRETRHVLGLEWLTATDVWNGTLPADRIALGSYPLDLHPVTAGDHLAYAPLRHVYGISFGMLVPRGLANLLVASPAISAPHIAAGSARVVPTTIEEGKRPARPPRSRSSAIAVFRNSPKRRAISPSSRATCAGTAPSSTTPHPSTSPRTALTTLAPIPAARSPVVDVQLAAARQNALVDVGHGLVAVRHRSESTGRSRTLRRRRGRAARSGRGRSPRRGRRSSRRSRCPSGLVVEPDLEHRRDLRLFAAPDDRGADG